MTQTVALTTDTRWAAWTTAAAAAVVWHGLIDQHIGLNGPTSEEMTIHQAGAGLLFAMVIAWWMWMVARAATGDQGAIRSIVWITGLLAVGLTGVVAFFAAPPPSADFPYQDISHAASLSFGVTALWRMRSTVGWGSPGRYPRLTVGLFVVYLVVSGSLMVSNM